MTMKKILIIFLSFILAISCSDNNVIDPLKQQDKENIGGGGHLNNYGNGDLIENGSSDAGSITAFINKHAGIYYADGAIEFKLKDGKLYQLPDWKYSEVNIADGVIVEPNGIKMQISNRRGDGTIEVLNFANNGLSSYSSFVLEKDADIDTTMNQVAKFDSLKSFKGTFKEYNAQSKNFSSKFLSISDDGTVYFKEAISGSGRVYINNGDLVIIDNDNNKNIVKFKEGNFVYRKFTRSIDTDTTINTFSVSRDFVESLDKSKYEGVGIKVEFNKFIPDYDNNKTEVEYEGTVKTTIETVGASKALIQRPTKYCVLKGNTLYRFNGNRIDFTLTFNGDKSEAAYSKGGTLNRL